MIYLKNKSSPLTPSLCTRIKRKIKSSKIVAVDIEATGLDQRQDTLLLLAIKTRNLECIIDCQNSDKELVIDIISSLAETKCIFHNGKYDIIFLKHYSGIWIENIYDTMLAEKVITAGIKDHLNKDIKASLQEVLKRYFKIYLKKETRDAFINRNPQNPYTSEEITYVFKDVEYLEVLMEYQLKTARDLKLFHVIDLENKCVPVYSRIEYTGIYMNTKYWEDNIIKPYTSHNESYYKKLQKAAHYLKPLQLYRSKDLFGNEGTILNFNSVKETLTIFSDILSLDMVDKHGKPSVNNTAISKYIDKDFLDKDIQTKIETSEAYLSKITENKEVVELLLYYIIYNESRSILTKFAKKFTKAISPVDNRIHASFFQIGTDTGRATCKDPPFQTIPANNLFRKAFQAQRPDWKILTIDFEGAELRIMADGSSDNTMIEAFNNNEDVHSKMASLMNGGIEVSKEVNKHLRTRQKSINFGIAYGGSAQGFAPLFDGDVEKAKKELKKFFDTFPKIKKFFDKLGKEGSNRGHSCTYHPYNRIRWYPKVKDMKSLMTNGKTLEERKDAKSFLNAVERKSKNHPIQGTSADVTKLATCYVDKLINENYKGLAFIIHQVHDELVVEFNANEIDEEKIANEISACMSEAGNKVLKKVKMTTDYTIANSWVK